MNRRKLVQMLTSSALLVLVTGCASTGLSSKGLCGPSDRAIYLAPDEIDHISDETAKRLLEHNEVMVKKGCAQPN